MKRFALMSILSEWNQNKLMYHDCYTKKEAIEYFRECYPSMMLGDCGQVRSGDLLYKVVEQYTLTP